MTKENNEEKLYPVKSLHDFLSELDKEWTKFRNGTLIGLVFFRNLILICCLVVAEDSGSQVRLDRFCSFDFCRHLFRLQHLRHVLSVPLF